MCKFVQFSFPYFLVCTNKQANLKLMNKYWLGIGMGLKKQELDDIDL